MKRYLEEPLLHFLIAGGLLFGLYAWLNPAAQNTGSESRQVRIGAGEVRWVMQTWSRQRQREPTTEELRALVKSLVREEVFSREAREMRLDENDTIVRRRLAQKLEFLMQDTARIADPTEDDLRGFYQSHPERFQTPGQVSFTQVYFNPQRRKDAARDAKTALARLPGPALIDTSEIGDHLLVEAHFRDADEQTVASTLGPQFSGALFALQPGAWHGPIVSGYGLHLVYVSKVEPPRTRPFIDVRRQVAERWREQQQRDAEERYFARLMQKYNVVIDDSVKSQIGPIGVAQMNERPR
jgi:hypothetical protein